MYKTYVTNKEQALFHLLLFFATKDGELTDPEIETIMQLVGPKALAHIDTKVELRRFYDYKDSIDDQQTYLALLLSLIGKTYTKLLFFQCCQVCFSDMEFDASEKRGLDILAYIMDLDKRQKLTIEQIAMEKKLGEVEGMFIGWEDAAEPVQ